MYSVVKKILSCPLTAFSLVFIFWRCPVENAGNGISVTVKLEVFSGSILIDPACLERLQRSHFSSSAYAFKISRYAPEISKRREVLPLGWYRVEILTTPWNNQGSSAATVDTGCQEPLGSWSWAINICSGYTCSNYNGYLFVVLT